MKILIRSTTLEGEPIPGSGEIIEGRDCLEVVEMMRHQTPFTAVRSSLEYMADVLKGIEGDSMQPLPEGSEAASAEFLTRLAKHGLIEFLPCAGARCEVAGSLFLVEGKTRLHHQAPKNQ